VIQKKKKKTTTRNNYHHHHKKPDQPFTEAQENLACRSDLNRSVHKHQVGQ